MLRKTTALIFALTVFSLQAFADDSCVADVSKYTQEGLKARTSIFDLKDKNVSMAFPSELVQYGFVDKIQQKNGTMITYNVGGCAHYGYSFTFAGKSIAPVTDARKLSRAQSLLKKLKLIQKDEQSILLSALAEAKKSPLVEFGEGSYQLPCGDAVCTLTDSGNEEVVITYDFPL